MIERVPSSSLGRREGPLDHWKALQRDGWQITALISPDRLTVIAFGFRPD